MQYKQVTMASLLEVSTSSLWVGVAGLCGAAGLVAGAAEVVAEVQAAVEGRASARRRRPRQRALRLLPACSR